MGNREKREAGRDDSGNKDQLTDLYHRDVFFYVAGLFLTGAMPAQFCMVAVDIEHFKLFNEWYGREDGDRVLAEIGGCLNRIQKDGNSIAGYIGRDDFAVILPNDSRKLQELQDHVTDVIKAFHGSTGFFPDFGVYEIDDPRLPVSTMYDRALIAMTSIKGNYARRVGYYNRRMKEKMEEDHLLLSEVQQALVNHEFIFYVQPKCNLSTGKIIGMEALVRWVHPKKGMIPPDKFLPFMERSGLITQMDLYIWEQICKSIRQWIDRGLRPLPISLNVSRKDLYAVNVTEVIENLVKKYELSTDLVEIEITESAYVEEYGTITAIVERLRTAGFHVLMDDFGSGYSSLNMLRDVKVDILKIDMRFLQMNAHNQGKGASILEAVTRMANIMGLRMIAEGVETKEQVDFLLNLGCVYGQGYYFYRPMPREEFEKLLENRDCVDYRGIQARRMERLRLKELFNEDIASDTMMNNILGPVAFYDVYEDRLEIIRVNEQYYMLTGTNSVDLEGRRRAILQDIHEEDRSLLRDIFERAFEQPLTGAEGTLRRKKGDGSYMWLHLRVFFLREQDGHRLYYGAASDVTEHKTRERQLESSQRALSAVVHISENDESFMKLTEKNRRVAASIFSQMSPGGMIGGYCEDGFPLYFANNEMVSLLGYDSYEEFEESIGGMVGNTIHPDDQERVARDIGPRYYAGLEYTTTYRMPKKDGSWFWTLDKGRVIEAEDGRLAIVSACTDISEPMEAQQALRASNSLLERQNEELNFLHNYMPGGYHRCANNEGYEFIYISNRFLEIFGYTRAQIKELFDDKFMNMVHPDDRKNMKNETMYLVNHEKGITMQYRMLGANGYITVIDQTKHLQYDGRDFFQGVIMDISELVHLKGRLQLLIDHMPEDLVMIRAGEEDYRCEVIACGIAAKLGMDRDNYLSIMLEHWSRKKQEGGGFDRLKNRLDEIWGKEERFRETIYLKLPGEREVWIDAEVCFLNCEEGQPVYLMNCSDISHVKKKEQELRMMGRKSQSLLQNAGINSWEWDVREDILTVTSITEKNVARLFYDENGKFSRQLPCYSRRIEDFDYLREEDRQYLMDYLKDLREKDIVRSLALEIPIQIGEDIIWISSSGETVCDEQGRPAMVVGYSIDVTEKKEQEQELLRRAETDALTGLYNRESATTRIRRYLKGNSGSQDAFIMFDLDNFKQANDVFGHAYGDELIRKSAEKLKKSFRKEDIICRIGGDEFAVLCRNIKEEDMERRLTHILQDMFYSSKNEDGEIRFSVSAGYAMIPEQGRDLDELYEKADVALFAAKMSGKSMFKKYDPVMKSIRYELKGEEETGGFPEL